ncbi:MAG: type I methionyl aminopeptidase [Clostridia bacterium]|nr:type I methionyl aminopeptidase [Clostridia bacterium]
MIQVKNSIQIAAMKDAGRITGEALLAARDRLREGITTYELDKVIHDYIVRAGARPSFLGYAGFPGSACISINDEVIHGIPSKKRVIKNGDVVKIDVGAYYKGVHGDSARTIGVGEISSEAQRLIDVTRESFFRGIAAFAVGNRIGDIGHAIDSYVVENGFSTVKRYVGHGIGADLHESPDVPNFGTAGRGARLCNGMALAIEPMVNVGAPEVLELSDGWTVKTVDHSLSAHYENTVVLVGGEVLNLTLIDPQF